VSAAQVEGWLATIAAAPVTDALAAATTATGTDPYASAKAHLAAIVDTGTSGTTMYDLFARRAKEGAQRDTDISAAADRVLDARQSLLATQAPLDGALAQAATTYARRVAVLKDLAGNAVIEFATATASLAGIAAAARPTVAEQAAITVATEQAAVAAPHESAVYDANDALRAALVALDAVVLRHLESDPGFDPSTAPEVQHEREAVAAARIAVQTAVDTLTSDERSHLATYDATLPDPVKEQIVSFFLAEALIAKIAAFGANVSHDVGTAATALAAGRRNAAIQRAAADRLDREVSDRAGAAAARALVSAARGAALIRGEGSIT